MGRGISKIQRSNRSKNCGRCQTLRSKLAHLPHHKLLNYKIRFFLCRGNAPKPHANLFSRWLEPLPHWNQFRTPSRNKVKAVVYGLHQCRYFVLGCMDLDRRVIIDHKPLLYVLNYRSLVDIQSLQLKTFTCTVTVADFRIYFVRNIIIYKCLNALSQQTTFVGPIAINYSYMDYCKNCSVSIIPIHNFYMHHQIF